MNIVQTLCRFHCLYLQGSNLLVIFRCRKHKKKITALIIS